MQQDKQFPRDFTERKVYVNANELTFPEDKAQGVRKRYSSEGKDLNR